MEPIEQDALEGVWILKGFELLEKGRSEPWGTATTGILIYTTDGFVSVGINRNIGKTDFCPVKDSLFYSGTYELCGREIVHHIQVATDGNRIGREMRRNATMVGEKLELTGTSQSGRAFRLIWARS